MAQTGRRAIKAAKRVVVKIGTGALTNATGRFNRKHFEALAEELLWAAQGRQLVVVSSGAIALGVERLGLASRPKDIPGKQACAAVGQSRLMLAYEEAFGRSGRLVAQVLLTHDDVQERQRYLNARHALERLLEAGVVPVINENDTVSVDELKFGDNDALASLVAGLVGAEVLVILSDVDGLYDADPRSNPDARLIEQLVGVPASAMAAARGSGTAHGTGGMESKLLAAMRASELGIRCVIASGQGAGKLRSVLCGEPVGTLIEPTGTRRQARAAWIAHAVKAKGKLWVDEGAQKAVLGSKRSLLPSGLRKVEGSFQKGDPVDLVDADGRPFARGLCAYSAEDLRKIAGCKSAQIEQRLGYRYLDEAVHRDDLALLEQPS